MKRSIIGSWKIGGIGLLLICFATLSAQAGSSLDSGRLSGTPAAANFVAWISPAVPPTQVITEDAYNPSTGPNQGYQSGNWWVATNAFDNPPPATGQTLNIVFGGLGADNNKIWTYSAVLDTSVSATDHGVVGSQAAGTCPTMLPGSQDATGKTLNWSGSYTTYLVYRSKNASGSIPPNGYSNGRYDYVATVTGSTYKDTACATGTPCWHIVIPASSGGVIISCHSIESNPTAIALSKLDANHAVNWPLIIALAALGLAGIAGVTIYRRRAAVRA